MSSVAVPAPRRAPDRRLTDHVVSVGRTAGLAAVGVASADPFADTRAVLEARAGAGLAGGMQFTYRNPARSTEPQRILPGARSLVVGAWAYRHQSPPLPAPPAGRVAAYAWRDHYADLRAALATVADALLAAGHRARVVADDNALVDRAAAHRAGIGWYGKNTNLLLPGAGSWFVLGSVVTDAALRPAEAPVADGCGPCARCLDGCPTGAIVAPGVLDARRCLAWLVQATGPFPLEHRAALGDRIYGCDDCQEVCPPNRRHDREAPAASADAEAAVALLEILTAPDDVLLARHGRWYVPRRDPRYLRRNALVALGNTAAPGDRHSRAVLEEYRDGGDALLAEHAVWALDRIEARSRNAP